MDVLEYAITERGDFLASFGPSMLLVLADGWLTPGTRS